MNLQVDTYTSLMRLNPNRSLAISRAFFARFRERIRCFSWAHLEGIFARFRERIRFFLLWAHLIGPFAVFGDFGFRRQVLRGCISGVVS